MTLKNLCVGWERRVDASTQRRDGRVMSCHVLGVQHTHTHTHTHTHWYFAQKVNPFDAENKMSHLYMLLSSVFITFCTYQRLKKVLCIYQGSVVIRNRILEYKEYIHLKQCTSRSRDSSIGIATRYGLDGPGIESR
jgi:hypothetical protein